MTKCDVCGRPKVDVYEARWFAKKALNKNFARILAGFNHLCRACLPFRRFPPGKCPCGKPAEWTALGVVCLCEEHLKEFVHTSLDYAGLGVQEDNLDYKKPHAAYYPDGFKAIDAIGYDEVADDIAVAEIKVSYYETRMPLPDYVPPPEKGTRPACFDISIFSISGGFSGSAPDVSSIPRALWLEPAAEAEILARMFPGNRAVGLLAEGFSRESAVEVAYMAEGREKLLAHGGTSLASVPVRIEGPEGPEDVKEFARALAEQGFIFVPGRFGLFHGVSVVPAFSPDALEADINGFWAKGLRLWAVKPMPRPNGPYAEIADYSLYPGVLDILYVIDTRWPELMDSLFAAVQKMGWKMCIRELPFGVTAYNVSHFQRRFDVQAVRLGVRYGLIDA